jgi:hypothetical protein
MPWEVDSAMDLVFPYIELKITRVFIDQY